MRALLPPLSALLLASVALPVWAQSTSHAAAPAKLGGLIVAPTRVVFDGRSRTAVLTLSNPNAEMGTYRLSFTELRMDEKGNLVPLPEGQGRETSAASMLRYSPRQVTLAQGESQTVRIQVRKPASLPAGEYRSHLLFRSVPAGAEASSKQAPEEGKGMSMSLTPIYGVSIPVIVREGQTAAQVWLSDLKLHAAHERAPQTLGLRLHRTGNRSVYGNFTVTWTAPGGRPVSVGMAKGVAVYATNASRLVQIPLSKPVAGGRLDVTFNEADAPMAAAELVLR